MKFRRFAFAITLAAVSIAVIGTSFVVPATRASAAPVGQLEVDATRPGHAELAWTEVDGASTYTVTRNGATVLPATDTLRFDDTSVSFGATYLYSVTADVGGSTVDVGSRSASIPAVADSAPPTAINTLAVTSKTDSTVALSWKGASDDVGVIAYMVFSGGVRMAFTEGTKSVTVKNLLSGTQYSFAVRALDAAGNFSTSVSITATTNANSETTAPSTPPGVKATPYSQGEIDVTWGASTDNHSLAGYRVYRSDQVNPIADFPVVKTRFFADTNVTPGITYGYRIEAYDSAGNRSAKSGQKSAVPLAPGTVKVVRGPLVQQVDQASAQITWRTNIPAPSQLSYTAGGVTKQVTDPVARTNHAVLIGGLPSGASISYTISYATDSKPGSFQTCGQVGDASNIDVVGDFGGGGSPEADIAGRIAADHPDMVISTGDNVYPAGEDVDYPAKLFQDYAAAFAEAPFWTAWGNHDYYDPGAVASHLNLTQPNNESWFSFNCSSVHVLVLDTEIPYAQGSPQYAFAQSDLASASAPWKIVVVHRPPYSSSSSASGVRAAYQPLFEQYGVDVVFQGHSHNYERSNPINGVTYVVTGGGGNGLNSFSGAPPSWSAFRAAEYHYVQLGVTAGALSMTARRRDGTILDQSTITKTDTGPPSVPGNLQVSSFDDSSVSLAWDASTDDVGVTNYRIFRDGSLLTEIGNQTTFTDTGLAPNTTYRYVVRAVDAAQHTSGPSNEVVQTTSPAGPDLTPPSIPQNLHTVSSAPGDVEMAWDASTDNVQVASYEVFRDGVSYGTTPAGQLMFVDNAPQAGEQHNYQVRAIDTSTNHSDLSSTLTISVPTGATLFSDDFESGSLAAWSNVSGLTVNQGYPAPSNGLWVARENASGAGATYAYKSISPTLKDLYARFRFKVISRTGSVDLMRFRNGSGGSKLSLARGFEHGQAVDPERSGHNPQEQQA